MKITQFNDLNAGSIDKLLTRIAKGEQKLYKVRLKAILRALEQNENIIRHLKARIELLLLRNK